jgi:hypothetical protein
MADFTALEPISTGDVIDRAVRLYRKNFTALISIAAVPSLSYFIGSLMFVSGYSRLLMGTISGGSEMPGESLLMIGLGSITLLASYVILMAAIAGMSRCIGDNVMLDEPISFRKCVRVVRRRIGDIVLMALLALVMGFVLYIVLVAVVMVVFFIVVFAIAGVAAIGLPAWLTGVAGAVLGLVGVAAAIIAALVVSARVVFFPQVLMIEGQSAGDSIGRSFRLGGKNWSRLGAILLFGYFVKASVLGAIGIPLALWLTLNGSMNAQIMMQPGWNATFTALDQVSGLLIMPMIMVSLTFLYFDSRVRKEGYDLDLLTIGLNKPVTAQTYWPPQPVRVPVFGQQSSFGIGWPYAATPPLAQPWPGPVNAPPGPGPYNQPPGATAGRYPGQYPDTGRGPYLTPTQAISPPAGYAGDMAATQPVPPPAGDPIGSPVGGYANNVVPTVQPLGRPTVPLAESVESAQTNSGDTPDGSQPAPASLAGLAPQSASPWPAEPGPVSAPASICTGCGSALAPPYKFCHICGKAA